MCTLSTDLSNKLTKTIAQFMEEGRMFSGYDLTIATREREKISLRHKDIRSGIHELEILSDAISFGFDQSNGNVTKYQKTQINVNGELAFIYHPVGIDPNQYQPRRKNSGSIISLSSKKNYKIDCRNRLLVPTQFLREAGYVCGDEVFVLWDANKKSLVISGNNNNNMTIITKQHVEKNGDLRLSSKTLNCAYPHNNNFDIKVDNNTVVVSN